MPPGPKSILEQSYIDRGGDGWEAHTWKADSPPEKILAALRSALSVDDACYLARLTRQAEANWRNKGETVLNGRDPTPELLRELDIPERCYVLWWVDYHLNSTRAEMDLLESAMSKGKTDGDTAIRLLERRWPKKYSVRREITGADGGPVDVNVRADAVRVALEQMQTEALPAAD